VTTEQAEKDVSLLTGYADTLGKWQDTLRVGIDNARRHQYGTEYIRLLERHDYLLKAMQMDAESCITDADRRLLKAMRQEEAEGRNDVN